MYTVWPELDHLPRQVLYGKLQEGVRRADRLLLRLKAVCKRDLLLAEINPNLGGPYARTRRPASWREGGGSQGRDEGQGRSENQMGGEKETTRISSRGHQLHLYQ